MRPEDFEKKFENMSKTNITVWTVLKWFLFASLFFAAIGLIGNSVGLFTKAISTPARVISKALDTDNVIHKYEWFHDVNAAYDAKLDQVVQYKSMYTSEEDKSERIKLRTEMAAMQQVCRKLATKYNANSEKMNVSIFKGWSLPPTLSYEVCN